MFFPNKPIVGLTATTTLSMQNDISMSLGFIDPFTISINPNRANIYFGSCRIKENGHERIEVVLSPLGSQLRIQRLDFPLTLVYGNLKTISSCYEYFSLSMGLEQYYPIGSSPVAKNRLFTKIHAQYSDHERERIVKELVNSSSKIRLLFVTVAFGIGVDVMRKTYDR